MPVEPPIRAVLACVGAGTKTDWTRYRQILDDLSDIAKTSNPALRAMKVKDVWHKTFDFVLNNAAALESRTVAIGREITSSSSAEAKQTAIARMTTHRTAMCRIRQFFLAFSQATGETRIWQDTWSCISGEAQDVKDAIYPPDPDSLPATSSVTSNSTIDNGKELPPRGTEGMAHDGTTICKCASSRTSDEVIKVACLIHSDIGRPANTRRESKAEKENSTCTQSNGRVPQSRAGIPRRIREAA